MGIKKKQKIAIIGIVAAAAVYLTGMLAVQSYSPEQAIERAGEGNERLRCVQIIEMDEMADGREQYFYTNPSGETCMAVVKKTFFFYRVDYLASEEVSRKRYAYQE